MQSPNPFWRYLIMYGARFCELRVVVACVLKSHACHLPFWAGFKLSLMLYYLYFGHIKKPGSNITEILTLRPYYSNDIVLPKYLLSQYFCHYRKFLGINNVLLELYNIVSHCREYSRDEAPKKPANTIRSDHTCIIEELGWHLAANTLKLNLLYKPRQEPLTLQRNMFTPWDEWICIIICLWYWLLLVKQEGSIGVIITPRL